MKDDAYKPNTILPAKPIAAAPQADPMEVKYLRFKALHWVVENNPNPHSSTQEELKQLGKELSQDKDFMGKIKLLEQNEAKKIEHLIQEKQRSLERDRGGLSM